MPCAMPLINLSSLYSTYAILLSTTLQIPESFADCLGGLLSVVGQNLALKIEAVGETSLSAVHANRPVQWTTANKWYIQPVNTHC